MERNKGVKRRFKSQAKQIFRSCLYELTKRPRVRRKEIRDRGKESTAECKCARKDVKEKEKDRNAMEIGRERNVQKFNFVQITSV